jgi:hypothetical protein
MRIACWNKFMLSWDCKDHHFSRFQKPDHHVKGASFYKVSAFTGASSEKCRAHYTTLAQGYAGPFDRIFARRADESPSAP